MKKNNSFVLDTNLIISAFLLPNSKSRIAFDKALNDGRWVSSVETFEELRKVLIRNKFNKYATLRDRLKFLKLLEKSLLLVSVEITITACRDPKDNKFLELAITAKASCIITGDSDLLILHPFRSIPILSPVDFIEKF